MNILPLVLLPDPLLRQKSQPVEHIDEKLLRLADDMLATMYDAPGIGLAAIQIGEPIRMLVLDIAKDAEAREPMIVINPEILAKGDEISVHEEGCLSIPEYFADVERPASITLRYLDRDGKQAEIAADGLLATVLQHEIDHLNGVLFIDHISKLKRDMVIRRFRKLARERSSNSEIAL